MPAYSPLRGTESSSLCICGCGGFTNFSTHGEPNKYIVGHARKAPIRNPNPEGWCGCGCGEMTKRAKRTNARVSKGCHYPFLKAHDKRVGTTDYLVDGNGCWIWQRSVDNGYGRVRAFGGDLVLAHRAYYEMHRGSLPGGPHDGRRIILHHKCEVTLCVNPDHLEPMLLSEHSRLHLNRRYAA